jgi:hypothetical protein
MSGYPWTRLYVDFPTGPKAVALGVVLQDSWAWKYVIRLWCYAARHQQDGHFTGPAAVATIESASGWSGASGALVDALSLQHVRLLDQTSHGFYVHDWHVYGGAHIEKLKKDRKRKRESRSTKPPRSVRGRSKERRKLSDPASPSPSLSPSPSQLVTDPTDHVGSLNSRSSLPPLGVVRGEA